MKYSISIPGTLWFTGLPAAGKSTLVRALSQRLHELNLRHMVIDGDIIRRGLSQDLGFSQADRAENIRRIREVAYLLQDAQRLNIVACITPQEKGRVENRGRLSAYLEVFVDCPLEVCVQRDPKGMYKQAIDGTLEQFTGITSPYERPTQPDLTLDTQNMNIETCLNQLWALLIEHHWIIKDNE